MMKKAILLLAIVPLLVGPLAAQDACSDAYVKAMTAQSPAERAQLLKAFLTQCAGKGNQYENFANANLALQEYPGKTPADVTNFGEKALALGGLDDLTKCQLLLVLSSLYSKSGQNLEKAKSYASQVTETARAAKSKETEGATTSAAQWNQMIGAGFFALGQAREKGSDAKGAVDAYANSYAILKNPKILASIKKLGKTLYDAKNYAAAEAAFKAAYEATKDPEIGTIYAQAVYRSDKEGEALVLFKELYGKKKSGELAYNIGIILAKQAKTNPAISSEAIRYLLEARFTYPAQAKQSRGIAENLFLLSHKTEVQRDGHPDPGAEQEDRGAHQGLQRQVRREGRRRPVERRQGRDAEHAERDRGHQERDREAPGQPGRGGRPVQQDARGDPPAGGGEVAISFWTRRGPWTAGP